MKVSLAFVALLPTMTSSTCRPTACHPISTPRGRYPQINLTAALRQHLFRRNTCRGMSSVHASCSSPRKAQFFQKPSPLVYSIIPHLRRVHNSAGVAHLTR